MDIDTIRLLLREGGYSQKLDFRRAMQVRSFSFEQAQEVINNGQLHEERPNEKPYPKCTIKGTVSREVAGARIQDELHIAVAIGPQVLFIPGYWPGDRPSRKRAR